MKSEKQLEKAQQSSELPIVNSSSSLKKTKSATTSNPKKVTDSDINIKSFAIWLDNLDSASRESFTAFAEDTFSPIQVYIYAKFLGYDGSIICVDDWVAEVYPKPDHLKVLLYEIEQMQEDVRKLRLDIENYAVKRDAGVARIAQMQKEIRGTIAQVDAFVSSKDRKGLLLAGAERGVRDLGYVYQDDPIEGPLQEAAMSVWARIQFED